MPSHQRSHESLSLALAGEAILTQTAAQVTNFDAELTALAGKMLATLRAAQGVGIAAPQVHSSKAMFIMASHPNPRYPAAPTMAPLVLVNPEIITRSPDLVVGEEGCLSLPGCRLNIWRHRSVGVRYQDLDGIWQTAEFSGFIARIFQHEYDHLQGVTLRERVKMPEQLSGQLSPELPGQTYGTQE
ncbi:peptide deformylase [Shewanella sp. AS16]|uniref:peptide deformylase n=1 Tax=Shewanella sp. AS16 TaxID=2907625 RepID=UPI001F226C46|nr:peptide deformylase [Shewanella sp. AS16]MCE9686929.1 peptide deformylase [Shewanella sp. AS16]